MQFHHLAVTGTKIVNSFITCISWLYQTYAYPTVIILMTVTTLVQFWTKTNQLLTWWWLVKGWTE